MLLITPNLYNFILSMKEKDIMKSRRGGNLKSRYDRRTRQFKELMEAIYGPEADEIPYSVLLARHRDLAEKLLVTKKSEYDPFTEKPRVKILN